MTYALQLIVTPATAAEDSPTGKAAGNTRFTVTGKDGTVLATQDVAGLSASFTGLSTNAFTASAQLLDVDGANLFDPVTKEFTDSTGGGTPTVSQVTRLASLDGTVTAE